MDTLYTEILEYLKTYIQDKTMLKTLTKEGIIPHISNYGDYTHELVPKGLPTHIYKYINIPLMIHDLHEEGHILIFCFSPSEDNETLYSSAEYDLHENTEDFINGVKLLDESDIREQITANIYTGGFWDEDIHWVLNLKSLIKVYEV